MQAGAEPLPWGPRAAVSVWGGPWESGGLQASCWAGAERSSCRAGHLGPWGEGQRGRCRPLPSPVPAPLHQRLTDDPRSFAPPHLVTLSHGVTQSDLERQVCRGRGCSGPGPWVHTPLGKAGLWASPPRPVASAFQPRRSAGDLLLPLTPGQVSSCLRASVSSLRNGTDCWSYSECTVKETSNICSTHL